MRGWPFLFCHYSNLAYSRVDSGALVGCLVRGNFAFFAGCLACDLSRVGEAGFALFPAQEEEADDDDDPVYVVGNDRAIGRAVLPAEQGVEDSPTVKRRC